MITYLIISLLLIVIHINIIGFFGNSLIEILFLKTRSTFTKEEFYKSSMLYSFIPVLRWIYFIAILYVTLYTIKDGNI